MKKPLILLFIVFSFTNNVFSKTLDLEITTLEVPNKYYLVNWNETDFANEMCKEFSKCYGIVDQKIFEIVKKLNSGVNIDELEILKPLIAKYQKVMLSDKSFEKETKSLIKMFKSTLNKNKSGTIFGSEGLAINMSVYIDNVETEFLPLNCNWIASNLLPKYDDKEQTFVEPYLPNYKIGIMHLAAGIWKDNKDMRLDKNVTIDIKNLDGNTVLKSLRFNR